MNPTTAMFTLAVIVGSVREGQFGPVVIRDTVSFHGARERFDEHGAPREPDAVNTAAGALLDQLAWWAHTLRHARAARPYGT